MHRRKASCAAGRLCWSFTLVWDNPILARFRVVKNNNTVEKLRRLRLVKFRRQL
jgi:hypothetical protein